jgi:hypothetical protein
LWLVTTDGGSDVSRFRKILRAELRNSLTDLVIDANCVMHSDHLVIKSGLKVIDLWCKFNGFGWRWFASLAILMNTWRDIARSMFLIARRLPGLGPVIALQHFKRMPPRCLAGRWHSVAQAVARKLEVGDHSFSISIVLVLQLIVATF